MIIKYNKTQECGIIKIGGRLIGYGQPTFIIAEVGVNHHGDSQLCSEMITAAATAGADAVKLQTVDPSESYVSTTDSHLEFKNKTLSDLEMRELMHHAGKHNILLFSTPGDFPSLERIIHLGMPAIKISSGLMTNVPLIARAAESDLPLIISTGLAYKSEIADAIQTAHTHGAKGVAVLKCTALYPAPDNTLNLSAISTFTKEFGVPIGYSDHTQDGLACMAAVAFGATIIEKHFTLDKNQKGADHYISAEPHEFAEMVSGIRRIEKMRGNGRIEPVDSEIFVRNQRHRCLVARTNIAIGEPFTRDNVALKRPMPGQLGLAPAYYDQIMGKLALQSIQIDQPIIIEFVAGM